MGARQPAVEWGDARFRPHPEQGRQRDRDLEPGALGDRTAAVERPGVRGEEDGYPGARAAEVGDGDVDEDRAACAGVAARDEDRGCGQQGHQLPAGEERQWVASKKHLGKGEDEGAGQGRDRPAARAGIEVARREDEHRGGDEAERAEEVGRKAVDAEPGLESARETGARGRPGAEGPEAGDGEERRPGCLRDQPRAEAARERRSGGARREQADPREQDGRAHSEESSRRSDCCVASCRVMISRPVASSSKTRSSSTV